MAISSKNILQEYYQKLGLTLPIYNTQMCSDGFFVSHLQLSDGIEMLGTPRRRKIDAEKDVAEMAISCMKRSPIGYPDLVKRKLILEYVILIDLENIPKGHEELLIKYENIQIIGFVSKSNPLADIDLSIKKIIFPTTRKDGSDIGIVLYFSKLIMDRMIWESDGCKIKPDKMTIFMIMTRDHFASSIVDVAPSIFDDSYKYKIYHVVSYKECMSIIDLNEANT